MKDEGGANCPIIAQFYKLQYNYQAGTHALRMVVQYSCMYMKCEGKKSASAICAQLFCIPLLSMHWKVNNRFGLYQLPTTTCLYLAISSVLVFIFHQPYPRGKAPLRFPFLPLAHVPLGHARTLHTKASQSYICLLTYLTQYFAELLSYSRLE